MRHIFINPIFKYRTVNMYSDLQVSDGLFNDDRLAGQLKSSVGAELGFGTAINSANSNFGWSLLGKPARLPAAVNSLAHSADCRPAHHSFRPTACVRSGRSPARSYQRKPCLQPAPTVLEVFCFKERVFWNARSVKRDAKSANTKGEARTSRSAPNFGCPAANFWNTA
jgi:hypothetical protein